MQDSEDRLIATDGHFVFEFEIQMEPELQNLFDEKNTAFYFIRFCYSLPKLSVDEDILASVPQLLTNKLPIYEYEKNESN